MGHLLRLASLSDRSAQSEWVRLREQSSTRSPFNDPDFIHAVWSAQDADPNVLFVERESDTIAACVVFEKKRGPFTYAGLPPFVPFTPLVLGASIRESDVNQHRSILDSLEAGLRERYDQVQLQLPIQIRDPRPFTWNGWNVNPFFTPIAPLPDSAQPSTWSKGTAQLIGNHANDYSISSEVSDITDIVGLVENSYVNNDRSLPSKPAAVETMIKRLVSSGIAVPYLARANGSGLAEAGVIALRDGPDSFYWMAGSSRGPAMTVLLKTMLTELHESGCTSIDFVGANTASIAEFKRHFNTSLVQYYGCSITTSKTLKLLEILRS